MRVAGGSRRALRNGNADGHEIKCLHVQRQRANQSNVRVIARSRDAAWKSLLASRQKP
jgi:hypothetical protein